MGQEQLQAMLEKLGSIGVVPPLVILLAGLGLWLLGRKLARPACVFSGLVLGGIAGLVVGEAVSNSDGLVLPMVIGAAIAGALLAALLFRVWMAISGALVFGLVASSAVLLWQGPTEGDVAEAGAVASLPAETSEDGPPGEITLSIPNEVITEAIRDLATSAIEGVGGAEGTGEAEGNEQGASTELTLDNEMVKKMGDSLIEALRGLAEYYRGELAGWWSKAGSGVRGGAAGLGLVAAVLGLLLGLIWPYAAASVQSAAAGSVLMLFSSFSLLAQLMPDRLDQLPATPRGVLLCLGLITVIGLVLQSVFFARKTDR
jgi:hypothetical protein